MIGQSFTDDKGNPIPKYFQSRPSAAGDGYDPTATSASNLGPESVVDTLPDPDDAKQSLLTQVCARSVAVGKLEGVDGCRPYCTADGVGAVLGVFYRDGSTGPVTRVVSVNEACPATPFLATYQGVTVECAKFGEDYAGRPDRRHDPRRRTRPRRRCRPTRSPPAAPASTRDQPGVRAVAGRPGRQGPRPDVANVLRWSTRYTSGRALGFMGEPAVNVLQLNLALDQQYPYRKTDSGAAPEERGRCRRDSCASTSAPPPASARPTRCSTKATGAPKRGTDVVVGSSRPTAGPRPRRCSAT